MVDTDASVKMQLRFARELLASSSRDPQRDAALLLCRVLGKDRAWLWTHPDVPLTDEQRARYEALLARRFRHEPMQYILGEQEFYGLRFAVNPHVLIPRPETELLVEAALKRIPPEQPARVVDVGTGSGAIAVALAHARPRAQLTAVDLSRPALHIAAANAHAHGVDVRFVESDLLAAAAGERFDLVVSNPPYIANCEALEPQVRQYEPAEALFAGPTGLEVYERLIPQAAAVLAPEGWLLLEIGFGQSEKITSLLKGWEAVSVEQDLQGIDRVLAARRPAD